MQRYGMIVTEKHEVGDSVMHFLKRGTLVRYLDKRGEWDVQCVIPCYPIDLAVTTMGLKAHKQCIAPEDVLELPPDQLKALSVTGKGFL